MPHNFSFGYRISASASRQFDPRTSATAQTLFKLFAEVELLSATLTIAASASSGQRLVEYGFAPSGSANSEGLTAGTAAAAYVNSDNPLQDRVSLDFSGLDPKVRGTLFTAAASPTVVVLVPEGNVVEFTAYVKFFCRGSGEVASSI